MTPKQITGELRVRDALKQQLQIFQKNPTGNLDPDANCSGLSVQNAAWGKASHVFQCVQNPDNDLLYQGLQPMFPRWPRANVTWLLNKLPHLINVLYLMWKAQEGGSRGQPQQSDSFMDTPGLGVWAPFLRSCPKLWDAVDKGSGDDFFLRCDPLSLLNSTAFWIRACCDLLWNSH